MERVLSRMKVYDSRASSPGELSLIIQPIGVICFDGYSLVADPSSDPELEVASDSVGSEGPVLQMNGAPANPLEIACDGDSIDGFVLDATQLSNPSYDCTHGTLLGSVSYETFDNVITITDWEHYNWGDASPVIRAVQTLLSRLPSNVQEVRVLNNPSAFWTSLGFSPYTKGDPYLRLFR